MKKILNWLLKPFKNDFSYLFLLFLLISTIDIYDLVKNHLISYAIYICSHGYITAYFLCLIGQNLPTKSYSIYKKIILIVAIVCFTIDVFCQIMYESRFSQDFATIIMQTNIIEIEEYVESYISAKHLFFIVAILFAFWGLYNIFKRLSIHFGNTIHYIAFIGVIIGTALTIRNPLIYNDVFIGKIINTFQTPSVPNLKEYLTNPHIIPTKTRKPQNIIMIIGESFSKSHSSLYGYSKETNPHLQTLVTDSCLFIYTNIKSPATNTIPCFQAIMSTYKSEYKDSIPWYQCTTLPEILHHSDYYTYWVSNQSKIGLFDTVIGRYADLCNQSFFVGDKYAGMHRNNLDEEIIPLITPLLQKTNSNNFYFIHLMGSHSAFINRYPKTFHMFSPEDYATKPKHQRENLATYDNSILYNDFVVHEIIQLFKNQETIIFYFSDHAIDAYESSDDYMAHGKETDPKSLDAGTSIPFMIYTSPLYQQHFPNEMKEIKRCVEQPFRTDDMIYTIMDIIGVTIEGESLEGKSIFRLSSNENIR